VEIFTQYASHLIIIFSNNTKISANFKAEISLKNLAYFPIQSDFCGWYKIEK